jgi:hypothetical protein
MHIHTHGAPPIDGDCRFDEKMPPFLQEGIAWDIDFLGRAVARFSFSAFS